ncbi:hypothetical protein JH26_03870 [Microvirga sp. BSC39]|nr:hypothetical protein JH26_03870 [Microvirga sp. BSC39]
MQLLCATYDFKNAMLSFLPTLACVVLELICDGFELFPLRGIRTVEGDGFTSAISKPRSTSIMYASAIRHEHVNFFGFISPGRLSLLQLSCGRVMFN